MRIAFFTDTFAPQINGVAKTYQRLITYLQSRNIDTQFYVPAANFSQDSGNDMDAVFRFSSVNFPLYRDCRIALPDYSAIQRTLENYSPDLIHLATPFSLGLTGLKYAKQYGIPKVAVFHTNFPQYLEYYGFPQFKKLAWRFLRWFHRQADKNYCPSHDTARMMRLQGIANVELWTRGVDPNIFNPDYRSDQFRRSLGIEDKIILLYVGRLAPEKNVDVLLKALAQVNQDCDNLHLLLVGDGPSRKQLAAVAPPNVTFMGKRSGTELSTAYASADIFVCPSTTETFGNVILEAMASALPVVAPLSGGIKQNLFPMKTGLSCAPLKPESMANAIARLTKDEGLRRIIAAQAYEHAKVQSWNEVFSRLVSSYYGVVEQAKLYPSVCALNLGRKPG